MMMIYVRFLRVKKDWIGLIESETDSIKKTSEKEMLVFYDE
jgi:hypothetical protein